MADKPVGTLERKKDRRGLLALVGAGGAAALAALFSRNGSAEAGHDATNVFHLGVDNTDSPTANTGRTATTADGLRARRSSTTGSGVGVQGFSGVSETDAPNRVGVRGVSDETGVHGDGALGVLGEGNTASGSIGVRGTSKNGTGVVGVTTGGTGVRGGSAGGTGVRGDGVLGIRGFGTSSGVRGDGPVGVRGVSSALSGIGVYGVASSGKVGVRGDASGAGKTGVLAKATSGALALKVDGRARFTNAGTATIPAGKDQVRVTGKAFKPGAFALATIQSSPGRDTAVKWVRRDSSTSFTIVLTNPVTVNTKVGYFIVN